MPTEAEEEEDQVPELPSKTKQMSPPAGMLRVQAKEQGLDSNKEA